MSKIKVCKECQSPHIVNKFHCLCLKCNNTRLHGSEFGKRYDMPVKQNKSPSKLKSGIKRGLTDKAKEVIRKDEETYKKVFDRSDHRCEECYCELNTEFRDSEGRVIMRSRYSHILPKSIEPRFRHNEKNFNNLCLIHHEMWENGDKINMKIFEKNMKTICILRKFD